MTPPNNRCQKNDFFIYLQGLAFDLSMWYFVFGYLKICPCNVRDDAGQIEPTPVSRGNLSPLCTERPLRTGVSCYEVLIVEWADNRYLLVRVQFFLTRHLRGLRNPTALTGRFSLLGIPTWLSYRSKQGTKNRQIPYYWVLPFENSSSSADYGAGA